MIQSVRERLEAAGVRALAMTMVDNSGVTRVKAVPIARLERVARNGVGMAYIWAAAGPDDHFATVAPYDHPSGDMRLIPDLAAARVLAASPGWAWAPVDQMSQELEPVESCQRTVLKRVVERAESAGLQLKATFETEMTLLDADGKPATDGPGYSTRSLARLEEFALELVDALEAEDVEVEQFHPEYAPGQFELSVAPRDPLTAADEVVLLRTTTRQVARRHGLDVSFAPVVLPGEVGNGSHLHLSLWRDGENLMQGGDQHAGMTGVGASAVAGMTAALPELLAVLAPSVPAYERLQPHHWAGAYACWGVENREAALRFIPGTVTRRSTAANVEVKVVDGGANPYLAMAVMIGAALDGVERGAVLREPVQDDPASLSAADRDTRGIARLPASLDKATALLETSEVAKRVLGETLHRAFVAVRRMEWETYGAKSDDELATAYRWRY
ncbi:MAG: glutamine synthetase [Gaiellales bacterium]|jgi:glutamine synthetase|nr:glutamine synthetase [Gaiellales bacterium]